MPQGNVDLTFRVKGHKGMSKSEDAVQTISSFLGSGTVYFTSIRRAKGEAFTIRASLVCLTKPSELTCDSDPTVRFRIIKDDGQIVNIPITQPPNLLASSQP